MRPWRRSGCGGYAPVSTPPRSRGTIAIPRGGESQPRRESPFPNNKVVRRRHGRCESVIIAPIDEKAERIVSGRDFYDARETDTASRLIPIVNAAVFN